MPVNIDDGCMDRLSVSIALIVFAVAWPESALAQSSPFRFELGVQIASATSSEFESTDVGLGARLSWRRSRLLGIEAEVDLYPGDFPDRAPFSRARWEGLFGVTVGPSLGRVRPIARVRPGFVSFHEPSEPVACILIYPPPLACTLASGRTLFALDIGGGVEVLVTRTTFVRVDAGDRLLRYPGPAFDSRRVRENAFFSHNFRVAAGGGLRF